MQQMDEDEEDDLTFLDEGDKNPKYMLIMIAVLAVIAVVLCMAIWWFTHRSPKEEQFAEDESTGYEEVITSEDESEGDELLTEKQSESQENQAENEVDGGARGGMQQGDEAGTDSGTDSGTNAVVMSFQDINDTVTAKEVTNLRSEPSTSNNSTVAAQIRNGDMVTRTGINADTGWSRIAYGDKVLYAVTQYLTTEVKEKTPQQTDTQGTSSQQESTPAGTQTDANTVVTYDGREMVFTPCDDIVSPKMEVNLRGEPSTSKGNDTIHYRLLYNEQAHRTGYNEETGWSRVEYNGEVLYAVTSYLFVVEETTE